MKRSPRLRCNLRWLTVALGAVALTTSAAGQVRSPVDAVPIVRPARPAPDAPPPAPPPIPPGADHVVPLTLHVTIRRHGTDGAATSIRQVVSRTTRRVHLTIDADREWLFERNPVDNRRVEGALVVHSRRTIVMYDESALRNWLGLRGWADVLMLGLDLRGLSQLPSTGEVRTRAGFEFVRYTTAADRSEGVNEVWWCADQSLPLQFTTRGAGLTTLASVERIVTTVDHDLLRMPSERFPEYRAIDLSEWLEDS